MLKDLLTWQQIHDLYRALISIDIILFIALGIALIIGYANEPKVIAFETRLWKRIKRIVRTALLKSRRIREWAMREDLPDPYKVEDKIYKVRR